MSPEAPVNSSKVAHFPTTNGHSKSIIDRTPKHSHASHPQVDNQERPTPPANSSSTLSTQGTDRVPYVGDDASLHTDDRHAKETEERIPESPPSPETIHDRPQHVPSSHSQGFLSNESRTVSDTPSAKIRRYSHELADWHRTLYGDTMQGLLQSVQLDAHGLPIE